MEIISSIITLQLQGGLTIAAIAYIAVAAVWVIGAWAALRD